MYQGGRLKCSCEPLTTHWERLRGSDVTPHMDLDLLDHVSFWNCPLLVNTDYHFHPYTCKHLRLKNPELWCKTKRESNKCSCFRKNAPPNLTIGTEACLFFWLLIFKCPVALQKLPWVLKNTLDFFFSAVSMMPHLLAGSKPCRWTKAWGLLSQRQVLIMLHVLLVFHDNWPSEWHRVTLRSWLHCGYQMITPVPCHDSQSWHPSATKSAPGRILIYFDLICLMYLSIYLFLYLLVCVDQQLGRSL